MSLTTFIFIFCVVICGVVYCEEEEDDTKKLTRNGIKTTERIYDDCSHALRKGKRKSGIYMVQPKALVDVAPFYVYCDMDTDGGGWLVFQRRIDGSYGFYRPWASYKNGFGRLDGEMWLGNEKIHLVTSQKRYELRVDMADDRNVTKHAQYDNFFLNGEYDGYKLHVGKYSGNAGDSLTYHNGKTFKTSDRDITNICAKSYKGGWWYGKCHASNLNGLYLKGNHTSYANGVNWYAFRGYKHSLVFTEMKFRPSSDSFKNND